MPEDITLDKDHIFCPRHTPSKQSIVYFNIKTPLSKGGICPLCKAVIIEYTKTEKVGCLPTPSGEQFIPFIW